ncbi:amino acid racemase [Paenibacillus sp. P26]|nr:amino acid racemase [Paenibacillus sp. P26]UUZ90439.1 amino acid racemase [Paenibacillus sp. P25]
MVPDGDWEAYTNGLAEGIRALERAGADFAVIASNTPHIVYDELVKRVSLPVIHIAEALAAEAQEKGFKKLALLGTMATMNADFYQRVLARYGIECFVPGDKQKGIIQAVLDAELYKGIINEASRTQYIEIISEMKEAGADAVILGCTEIPMLISDANSPSPTLDSSLLLARAALDRSLA